MRKSKTPCRETASVAAGKHPEIAIHIDRLLRQLISRIEPDSLAAYLFATVLVAIAGLLRALFVPAGPDVLPFVTYFPATLFAAFVGGSRPGLYAAALGGLSGWWAFVPPFYQFFPLTPGAVVGLIAYAVTSLIIVWGADHHRTVIRQLRDEEAFRQMVVDELGHRLKNKVATILSIIGYQLRETPQLRDVISRRLRALSATDDLIMAAQGKGAALEDIVSTELGPYDPSRTAANGPKVMLDPKLALSLALIVHELATNAAKHGALSSPSGRVSIRWQVSAGSGETSPDARTLTLEWRESGGPLVSTPAIRGFGLRLLAVALDQFKGAVEPVFEPEGFVCRMTVPLPADTHGPPGQERETFSLGGRAAPSSTRTPAARSGLKVEWPRAAATPH